MEIVRVEDSDLQEIDGNRCRTFRGVSEPLTAYAILNDIHSHQRRRVIVICNTVSQSQGLFRDLEELDRDGELNSIHKIFNCLLGTFQTHESYEACSFLSFSPVAGIHLVPESLAFRASGCCRFRCFSFSPVARIQLLSLLKKA